MPLNCLKQVDKLGQFAKEVTRVSQEVGTEGYVSAPLHPSFFSQFGTNRKLGGQALVLDVEGTWRELTGVVNKLAANLTSQVCNSFLIYPYPSTNSRLGTIYSKSNQGSRTGGSQ